jgi:topoisomerase-4 subunit A
VIYREGKTALSYAKRFAVTGITRDKEYDITQGTPGSKILWFTVNHNGEAETVKIYLRQRPKLKKLIDEYDFSQLGIKGRASRGNLVSKNPIQKISLKSKGISTIGGKDIWFDEDIQRLNEDGRGLHLGQFNTGDHILAIFKDGTYYTTTFDLSNRYQGDLLKIEKLDINKVYTALYYDKAVAAFYVKRFSFDVSDNTPVSFISEAKGSYLVALSDDKHPQIEVIFGGKNENRDPELIDAEEFIAKKGIQAKGKKTSQYDVKKVQFIEPLHKPEDDIVPEASEAENQAGEIDNSDVIDDIPSDDSSDDDGQLTLF